MIEAASARRRVGWGWGWQLNEALEELEAEKGKELLALHAALDNHRRVADQARHPLGLEMSHPLCEKQRSRPRGRPVAGPCRRRDPGALLEDEVHGADKS